MEIHITTPLTQKDTEKIHAGDIVCITGIIYSARDAAHKRMYEALEKNEPLPFNMEGNIIYYLGPTPARPGNATGSAGPTTASRMDKYTPALLDLGLKGMIGKGRRSEDVRNSIVKNRAVYFAAVGGAGALLSERIKSSKVIAYDDLGTEAVRELYVEEFPVIAVIGPDGEDLYKTVAAEAALKQAKIY